MWGVGFVVIVIIVVVVVIFFVVVVVVEAVTVCRRCCFCFLLLLFALLLFQLFRAKSAGRYDPVGNPREGFQMLDIAYLCCNNSHS